ncbi:MAG TPA: gas vesicle protein GvpJ [Myxococcaceae bacterium]|nr:gas vesicle protein GvpJ [Myxococcaceae bacterium]
MALEREPGGRSLIDILDRVLDKGIVIEECGGGRDRLRSAWRMCSGRNELG